MRPKGPTQQQKCRTFGAHCSFNPIPALRPGLLTAGPSNLKPLSFKYYAVLGETPALPGLTH
jgi:hypothetical protein